MADTTLVSLADKQLIKQMQTVVDKLLAGQAHDYTQYKELVSRYKAFQEARELLRAAVDLYMENVNG